MLSCVELYSFALGDRLVRATTSSQHLAWCGSNIVAPTMLPWCGDAWRQASFFLAALCCDSAVNRACVALNTQCRLELPNINLRSDALPSEDDSFRTTGSPPHTPASRLRAPCPHKSGALFLCFRPKFGQAASRKQQRGGPWRR
jgi:hypothetical protein